MAYATMMVSNGVEVKKVPLGYSWTMACFGGIPCLFRSDWIWGAAMILANAFTWGCAGIIGAFFYNKEYAKALISKGFKVTALPPGYDEAHIKNYLGLVTIPMAIA